MFVSGVLGGCLLFSINFIIFEGLSINYGFERMQFCLCLGFFPLFLGVNYLGVCIGGRNYLCFEKSLCRVTLFCKLSVRSIRDSGDITYLIYCGGLVLFFSDFGTLRLWALYWTIACMLQFDSLGISHRTAFAYFKISSLSGCRMFLVMAIFLQFVLVFVRYFLGLGIWSSFLVCSAFYNPYKAFLVWSGSYFWATLLFYVLFVKIAEMIASQLIRRVPRGWDAKKPWLDNIHKNLSTIGFVLFGILFIKIILKCYSSVFRDS